MSSFCSVVLKIQNDDNKINKYDYKDIVEIHFFFFFKWLLYILWLSVFENGLDGKYLKFLNNWYIYKFLNKIYLNSLKYTTVIQLVISNII